jgi:hypothetical protein
MKRRGVRVAVLALSGLAAGSMAGLARLSSTSSPTADALVHPAFQVTDRPFVDGVKTSLNAARSSAGFGFVLPEPAAVGGTISTVWIETDGGRAVAVDYTSGVEVQMNPDSVPPDPLEHFQSLAELAGLGASVVEIDGGPALVIAEGASAGQCRAETPCQPFEHAPASVERIVGNLDVIVYGHQSTEQLESISSSLQIQSS